jgi:nucleoside-diphosphate-sugar epimerase
MACENVAVTGGTGLLGSHVMRRLHGRAALTAIDIKPPQESDRTLGTFVAASITDYDAMRAAFTGKDAVVHLAAIPNPREATAGVTFNTNVQGAWTVLQAAEDAGVRRVVVASSDSVFGFSFNPPDWPPQFLPVDETHPVRPTEFYSLSKKVTEAIAESYAARKKLEVLAIRPSHIVFPRGYPEIGKRGADVQNYHFWSWVAPEDVAQAFDLALNTTAYRSYDVFTIAAAEGMNMRPTLEMAQERWSDMPAVRRPEIYRDNPTAGVLDITKAREKLGYEPKVDRAALVAKAQASIRG